MRVVGKLDLDNPTILAEHGSWKHARNVQISDNGTYTENEDLLYKLVELNIDTNCIGYITTPNDIVLFYTINNQLEIKLLQQDSLIDKVTIVDNRYNNKELTGTYTYNYKGELIITFGTREHDGPELLIVNLTTIANIPIQLNTGEYRKIQLFPDYFISQPSIKLHSVLKGGSLNTGSYFISFCYEDEDGNRSDFRPLTNKILVNNIDYKFEDGSNTTTNPRARAGMDKPLSNNPLIPSGQFSGKSIKLDFTNLDTTWKYIRIAIVYYSETTLTAVRLTNKILFTTNFVYTIQSLNGLQTTSIENIVINNIKYLQCKSLTTNQNKLILFNLKLESDYFKEFQEVANNIKISYHTNKQINLGIFFVEETNTINTYLNSKSVYDTQPFKYGETYCFYIAFEYIKGGYISVNHIPNNIPSNLVKYITNKIYPDTFGTLATSNMSFHKFPEFSDINDFPLIPTAGTTTPGRSGRPATPPTTTPPTVESGLLIKLLGIDVENVVIPNDLKSICSGWRIFYAERTMDNITRLGTIHKFSPLGVDEVANTDSAIYYGPRGSIGTTIIRPEREWEKIEAAAYSFTLQYNKLPSSAVKHIVRQIEYKLPANTSNYNYLSRANLISVTPTTHKTKLTYYSGIDKLANDKIILSGFVEAGMYEIISVNDGEDIYGDVFNQTLVSSDIYTSSNNTNSLGKYGGDVYFSRMYTHEYKYEINDDGEQVVDFDFDHTYLYFEESPYNIENRHEGKEEYQKLFMQTGVDPKADKNKGSYINDEFGNSYDITYNKLNTIENPIVNFEALSHIFKNRLSISETNSTESLRLGWKVFRPNSYYDVGFNRGEGFKLTSADRQLYIQCRNGLFMAQIKDVLQLADGSQAWLGTGDLFDRPPQEMLYNESGGIGCRDYESAVYTPLGYLVIDRDRNSIYLVGESIKDLTLANFKQWFTETSRYVADNNFVVGFDYDRSRILIHSPGNMSNKQYTLSYNIKTDGLTSFHDYNYKFLINNRTGTYTINGNTINKFIDDPTTNPSFVDINFTSEPHIQKLFQSVFWQTEYSQYGKTDYTKTIDKLMVYNDTQCTGLLDVNKPEQWFDNGEGVYISDYWRYNNLLDAVINDNDTILFDDVLNVINVDKNRKNWFDMSQIISKFITIRLYSDNKNNQRIKLFNLMVEAIKDNR